MSQQILASFDMSLKEGEPRYSTAELHEMRAKEDPLYFFKEIHPAYYIGGMLLLAVVIVAFVLAFKKPKQKNK